MNGLGLVRADAQHTVTATSKGRLVASAGWSLWDMTFDGSPRRTAGLGRVLVHPDYRDRGIAQTVISVAVEHARAACAETMVLHCHPDQVPFFAQLGWSNVSVPVAFPQPDGAGNVPMTTMIYDLAGLPDPAAGVDLCGPPF
ncbi:GNAT family N-acetyltransferase [Streptomyces sp. Lzd4kr]|nr:GNAT family N-acetyltransferase [Streptomyces sp. Lzd4kr]